jgi:hypothetical protein
MSKANFGKGRWAGSRQSRPLNRSAILAPNVGLAVQAVRTSLKLRELDTNFALLRQLDMNIAASAANFDESSVECPSQLLINLEFQLII